MQSWTKRSRPWRKPSIRPQSSSNLSEPIGRLYSPQFTCSSEDASRTMNLSWAEREECLPVEKTIAPSRVILPSPRKAISSYSASAGRFQYAQRRFVSPWLSSPYSLASSAACPWAGVFSVSRSNVTASP